jgi:hypothetical protein
MAQTADKLREAWKNSGCSTMIMACSSCIDVFARYLPNILTTSLWEVMDGKWSANATAVNVSDDSAAHKLCVHDACTGRNNSQMYQSVRNLISQTGHEIEELRYSGEHAQCCGFGDDVWFANREQAEGFAELSVSTIENDFVVYCAMCKDLMSQAGGNKRTYHLLDILFGDDGTASHKGDGSSGYGHDDNVRTARPPHYKMPTLSQRQHNRAALRKRMLMEFWDESSPEELPGDFEYDLDVSPEVAEAMERRLILLDDIVDVIRSAEAGEVGAFLNKEDGSYLACKQRKFVTYWVRYLKAGEGFKVLSAYSHRMEIL